MTLQERKRINSKAHAIAHSRLGMDSEQFGILVSAADPASDGHISRCSDETALNILIEIQKMARAGKASQSSQQGQIARLMEILGWTWSNTAEYCFKITGKKNTKACNAPELSKIIRGMIATIDHHLASGRIVMNHTERFNYESHVRVHREARNKEEGTRNNAETKTV
jgi:hypothetical protein